MLVMVVQKWPSAPGPRRNLCAALVCRTGNLDKYITIRYDMPKLVKSVKKSGQKRDFLLHKLGIGPIGKMLRKIGDIRIIFCLQLAR